MFDITRITEAVGGLVGQASENTGAGGLMQQLSEAGLDLSQFDGLNGQEITDLLKESGFDMANIDIDQVAEMADQFVEGGDVQSIADLLATLTQRN